MNEVLALYDCRSKQEYIYRTNRVQEITGSSELLRNIFSDFIEECKRNNEKKRNLNTKEEMK